MRRLLCWLGLHRWQPRQWLDGQGWCRICLHCRTLEKTTAPGDGGSFSTELPGRSTHHWH
ncbi:MAG: hypothetical protein AB7K24_17430 [Gemmataceae bacterium]